MSFDISRDVLTKVQDLSAQSANSPVKTKKTKNPKKPVPVKPKNKKTKSDNSPTKFNFRLGAREGNTRIVDPNAISVRRDAPLASIRIDANGKLSIGKNGVSLDTIDGNINSSAQGRRGDCFFLAEINGIRNTKRGQSILKNNITSNEDGSITVKLPGAIKIRNEYAKKGLPCEVTGIYYITSAAVKKAAGQAGQSYSGNDIEVIALEIAMENYRAEMVKTNELNGNKDNDHSYTAEGRVSHLTPDDYLWGGWTYDAGYILTGEKSLFYNASGEKYEKVRTTPERLYKSGKYGYVTREEMERRVKSEPKSMAVEKGVSELSYLTRKDSDLPKMLDKYKGHEDEFALTFSVIVAKDGPDGVTKAGRGHALTVVKITDNTVYVSNPWYPDKIEPIPRADFEKMCTSFNATPMTNHTIASQIIENHGSNIGGRVNLNNNQRIGLEVLLNKINSNMNHTTQNNGNNMTPDRLVQIINRHNENKPQTKIDLNKLPQMLNKASNAKFSKEEKEILVKFFNGELKSDELNEKALEILSKVK